MRDEARARARAPGFAAACAAAVLGAAGAASAQPLSGHLQVQFQEVRQTVRRLAPDGSARDTTISSRFWIQNYELNHATRMGERLDVVSQLRLTDLSYQDRASQSRTPYGALRLSHPLFGLSGSYRPTTSVTAIGDTANGPSVRTRTQEALFSGYLAAPNLPRVDASWIRRHRSADGQIPEDLGATRSVQSTWDRGVLSMRGGYSDLVHQPSGAATRATTQRSITSGASLRATPRPALSIGMDADLSHTRVENARGAGNLTQTLGGTLTAGLRQSRRLDWALNYAARRLDTGGSSVTRFVDHDAGLLLDVHPAQAFHGTISGGARTARTATVNGLMRYASATAAFDGVVRPDWRGTASVSHVTSWNPSQSVFGVESFRGATSVHLRKGLDVTTDFQVTSNGDTAAHGVRVITQAGSGVTATPWRGLTLVLAERRYRSGPGLFDARSISHMLGLDLRWKPARTLDVTASLSRAGAQPNDDPRVSTRQWTARWSPGARFQMSGNWTRSDQRQAQSSAAQIPGREVLGGRLLLGLGRDLVFNAGMSVVDPGAGSRARQADVTITRSFGR
jgi:hypothetical protein